MNLILFFDSECLFCRKWIEKIKNLDKNKKLYFAPLNGITASKVFGENLQALKKENTLIYFDGINYFLRSKAIFLACGAACKPLSILRFLPTFVFDPIYRMIAKQRYRLGCHYRIEALPSDDNRFLP